MQRDFYWDELFERTGLYNPEFFQKQHGEQVDPKANQEEDNKKNEKPTV